MATVTRLDTNPSITTEYVICTTSAQAAEVQVHHELLKRHNLSRGDIRIDSVFPKDWVDLR